MKKIKQSLLIMEPRSKMFILYSSDTLDKTFCFRNVKYVVTDKVNVISIFRY